MVMVGKVFFSLLMLFVFCQAQAAKQIVVAGYNVENLFDTTHDEGKDDYEFLPDGAKKWTPEKLELKLKQVAASIRAINGGLGPDILAMPETENMNALKMLNAKLADLKYTAVLLEGPDKRGIDVAFLTKFPLARKPHMYRIDKPGDPTWKRPTRPVYEMVLQVTPKTQVTVLLNHWPSRANPPELRCRAAIVLKQVFKLHADKEPNMPVIALGDFNDEPEDISVNKCLGTGTIEQTMNSSTSNPVFFDSYFEKNSSREVRSTYYYDHDKEWDAIDHIIMSKSALKGPNMQYVLKSFKNVRNPITVSKTPIKGPKGKMLPPGAPIPFFPADDMSSAIGVSDHLPVRAVFEVQ